MNEVDSVRAACLVRRERRQDIVDHSHEINKDKIVLTFGKQVGGKRSPTASI
jgi:hypothetical protein